MRCRKHMTHSQRQERRPRQTPVRRTTSISSNVKQSISEQSLNARDGEKRHHLLISKRTKLWNLKIALNDEESKGQRNTLEDEGKTITGKAAANAFAKGDETESNTNIPLARMKKEKEQRK